MLRIVTSRVSEEFMILCTALILRRYVHNALIPVAPFLGIPCAFSCYKTLLQHDFSFYFVQVEFNRSKVL